MDAYRPAVGDEVVEELQALATPLDGVRVLHVNATVCGGGWRRSQSAGLGAAAIASRRLRRGRRHLRCLRAPGHPRGPGGDHSSGGRPAQPEDMPIGAVLATGVLDRIGVDTARPLLAQVSRFDP